MSVLSVVIGRFQTPYLHEGHLRLLEAAKQQGEQVLILIGMTAALGTDKNPMDFKTREQLFHSNGIVPNPIIKPLYDCPSDKDWSDQIDEIIATLGFDWEVILFGGRDNSIENYYSGRHNFKIIEPVGTHSATSLRKKAAQDPLVNRDFRAGIIYHVENRYPIVYSTVDVAIYRSSEWGNISTILMGKKGDKSCFVGGFVDSADADLETAARRELLEETGMEADFLDYEFSSKVEDARYKGTKDSIMTHCFSYLASRDEEPNFDKIVDKEFKEFIWMPAIEESLSLISEAHQPLFLKFINSKN